jgi:hypothetical protein
MCVYQSKQFTYQRENRPENHGLPAGRAEFITYLLQKFQGNRVYLPELFLVRSIKADTFACSAFKSGSCAYTIWPEV